MYNENYSNVVGVEYVCVHSDIFVKLAQINIHTGC